jgi:alkyl sulfatase BDS1-like metallo-beta-lactamase superfamily hydrolase
MDERRVDGVRMVFQLTPGTEAPAELNVWFPQFKVFDAAENVTQQIHNLYTLRGAEIRDGLAWAKYIDESRELFGAQAEVMIAQHTWPTWGPERIDNMLRKQRDLYKYIHDQTVRLMNMGYKPREIAEVIRLPDSIAKEWFARGYYGTVSHNTKAVYQRYLGWYDANPAHLNPLPEAESAKKYLDYMGGANAVIARARDDFKAGNYRWVAEVMNQAVFADPANAAARALEADALEQLGYQAESGVWRNVYLTAALELRGGVPAASGTSTTSADVIKAIPLGLFFDYLAVRLDAQRAAGKTMVINWVFSDVNQRVRLTLENSVLSHLMDRPADKPDATITLKRATLDQISLRQKTFGDALQAGEIAVSGNGDKLAELLGLIENFPPMFDVVTPPLKR